MNRAFACRLLALVLALPPAPAQQPAASGGLRITVLEGEGAINNVKQRTPRTLAVRVEGANQQPLAGIPVTFTLPADGPGGSFPSGASATVTTDQQGRAVVRAFRPNALPGKIEIRVTASHQGQTARAVITQFNMAVESAPKPSGRGKTITVLAIVGGAAAAGAVIATRKGGSAGPTPTSAPPALSVVAGAGSVGPPP